MTDEIKQNDSVLAERINGFTNLTAEQFSNIKESLARIEQKNLDFATKAELEETKKDFNNSLKRMEEAYNKHNEDDRNSFEVLTKGQAEARDTIKTWLGGLAVIAIILPIIVPLIFHYVLKI